MSDVPPRAGLRQVELADLGNFYLDEQNQLYWEGGIVHTSSSLNLTPKQNAFAKTVGGFAIAAGLAAMVNSTVATLTYFTKHDPAPAQINVPVPSVTVMPCSPPSSPPKAGVLHK